MSVFLLAEYEHPGEPKANGRRTLKLSDDGPAFSIRKEVRPGGASEFFERNTYSWKR